MLTFSEYLESRSHILESKDEEKDSSSTKTNSLDQDNWIRDLQSLSEKLNLDIEILGKGKKKMVLLKCR